MRAFITGAAGFAGLHLAEHLLACGDSVLGASRLGEWPAWTSAKVRNEAELFAWDVAGDPPASLARALAEFRPEVVYHLAAISTPADCGESEPNAAALAVNVQGTERLLAWALAQELRPRVVFVSTSDVYMPTGENAAPIDERWPLAPRRGYGLSKLAAEQASLSAFGRGLPIVIARPFQHTGPGQSLRMILPDWASQFASSPTSSIRAISLDTWLDLSDVRDVVRAYRLLALHGMPGEAYNVGSGRRTSGREIFAMLERAAGRPRKAIEEKPGARWHPAADIAKLTTATSWRPEIPLEKTVADTLEFWKTKSLKAAT